MWPGLLALARVVRPTARTALVCVLAIGVGTSDATADRAPPKLDRQHALAVPANGAAGQVHLSSAPHAGIIMSWVEHTLTGHRLMVTTLDDDHWAEPLQVATGDNWFVNWADFPSVIEFGVGNLAAHWLVKRQGGPYAYDISIALSRDGGRSWSQPFSPHDDGTATEHGFVSLADENGTLRVVWLDGRAMADEDAAGAAMTLRSANYSAAGERLSESLIDARVCDCCQTDTVVLGATTLVAYRDRSATEMRDIALASYDATGWAMAPAPIPDRWKFDACPVNGPALAINHKTVAVAWFTAAADTPSIRLARSKDGVGGFSRVWTIENPRPLGRVDVELLDDGRAVVSWLAQRGDQAADLLLTTYAAGGEESRTKVVARLENAHLSGFPQIARYGDALIVAWTTGPSAAPRIDSAMIPLSAL